jgi:hypothetical protein
LRLKPLSVFLSSEINFAIEYKEYRPHAANFGRITWSFGPSVRGKAQKGLGEFRPGKPANSPAGAISRRRGPKSSRRFLLRFPNPVYA